MEKYLKDSIDYMNKVDINDLKNNLLYQTKILDSNDFNLTLTTIEDHLNQLYDKTRVLEDITGYLKTNVTEQVTSLLSECEVLLKEIEISRDDLKTFSYKLFPVRLLNVDTSLDRDGMPLKPMQRIDSYMTMYSTVENNINIFDISRSSGETPYNENIKSFLKGEPYRVCYFLDNAIKGGLVEHIKATFNDIEMINQIILTTSNADATHFTAHKLTESITLKDLVIPQAIGMDEFSFDLICSNYEEKTYQCDTTRLQKDAFKLLAQNEINIAQNKEGMTQAELDRILGIEQYNKDYEAYLKELEAWKARRDKVLNQGGVSNSNYKFVEREDTSFNAQQVDTQTTDGIENPKIDTSKTTYKTIGFTSSKEDIVTNHYDILNEIYPSYEKYRYQEQEENR